MKQITMTTTVDLVPATWDTVRGTGLVGYLNATFAEIVAELGEPELLQEEGLKSDAEWWMRDATDKLGGFSIYNYKDGPNYLGAAGTPVDQITRWHVGGRQGSLELVAAIFGDRVSRG